jgi:hypothetical protein
MKKRLITRLGTKSLLVGEMSYFLYALSNSPERVSYQVNYVDPEIENYSLKEFGNSTDLVVNRTWPLFLEVNLGKIVKDLQDRILGALSELTIKFEAKKDLDIPQKRVNKERMIARFDLKLLLGKRMFLDQGNPFLAKGVIPEEAVSHIIPWCYGLALEGVSEKAAAQLKFFLAYGIQKWKRQGRPKAISASVQTWDFSNVRGMLDEFDLWTQNR